MRPSRVKAVLAGEKRPPRRGEWFVSRVSLKADLATSDLVVAEDVARLVLVQAGTVITEIGRAV